MGRGTENDIPSSDLLPKWPHWPRLGQTETESLEPHPGLPHGRRDWNT